MKLEGEWLNVIYSKTPNGVSHVTCCTHTPLTSAAAQGIPVHLVTTYIVCVSTLGDTRILPCKRSSIQEESEGVRVNGAI